MALEILIINLLSSREAIISTEKRNLYRKILLLLVLALCTFLLFILFPTFLKYFSEQKYTQLLFLRRTRLLYVLSTMTGSLLILFCTILLIIKSIQLYQLNKKFPSWIEKEARQTLAQRFFVQDNLTYYILKEENRSPKKQILKEDCQLLTTTFEGQEILYAQERQFFGCKKGLFLILTEKPPYLAKPLNHSFYNSRRLTFSTLGVGMLSLSMAYYYASSGIISFEEETTESLPFTAPDFDQGGLLPQQGVTPNYPAQQTNDLYWSQESNELFMTTNQGLAWQFVPITPEALRFGSYLLTSGSLPTWEWMDKSFQISSDFSWFIFSNIHGDVSFLVSENNGQTWNNYFVTKEPERVRYRKATFFTPDNGILFLVTEDITSREYLAFYTTNDAGKTWQPTISNSLPSPIQNISFISQTVGFIATREVLYYTTTGGRILEEAAVIIPEEYTLGGLDLFQSPNEVIQINNNQLEARFYLLKTKGEDQGKMFACRFQSVDNGETWSFVEELSPITLE